MIDPLLSLSFSVQTNKGIYALLLGSGVSRSAGIPTGWEITQDLIRKLAALERENIASDPEEWYVQKYGKEPKYSALLELLGKTPSERRNLLRGYFEPTNEEREEGKKQPTSAHRAIAELVSKSYIKVILTTNFDRLLEQALDAAGVQASVIKSPNDIQGAMPLAHSNCTIVKIHGDYLDTRLKNSSSELAKYSQKTDKLLDQIFDEYGLIVCGWSGVWDKALCKAIRRTPSRRFSMFWTYRGELSHHSKEIIELRRANTLRIKDADSFFYELKEKMIALQDSSLSHPLSVKEAVARLKRYVQNKQVISAHDLIMDETDKLIDKIKSEKEFSIKAKFDSDNFTNRVVKFDNLTQPIRKLILYGCYWSGDEFIKIWPECINRLSNHKKTNGITNAYASLRLYPAALAFFSAGTALIYSGHFRSIVPLFEKVEINDDSSYYSSAEALNHHHVISVDNQKLAKSVLADSATPLPSKIINLIKNDSEKLMSNIGMLYESFHYFEILIALVYADIQITKEGNDYGGWAPCGHFLINSWPNASRTYKDHLIYKEFANERKNWMPLRVGLFGGDAARAEAAFDKLIPFISRVRGQMTY